MTERMRQFHVRRGCRMTHPWRYIARYGRFTTRPRRWEESVSRHRILLALSARKGRIIYNVGTFAGVWHLQEK